MNIKYSKIKIAVLLLLGILLIPCLSATAVPYGMGTYGTCTYDLCGLTLTSSSNLNVNVTPSSSGSCSINKDSVSVLSDDSLGYTVLINNSVNSTSLTNGTSNITAVSGTVSSPTTLGLNQWGYRVDGQGGFGSGPTNSTNNSNYPISATFAGVPDSNSLPSNVVTSSNSANPAVTTNVWYGVCANTNLTSGTYSGTVLYTAVAN